MPALIAIDTSTDACSVASLWADDLHEVHQSLPRAHNRHVLAMVREVMGSARLDNLSAIVCGIGPGSFTGLRIATSVAQGLAWALGIPVIPFCSLQAQALTAVSGQEGISAQEPVQVVSCMDTQTGQVYARSFAWGPRGLNTTSEPWVGPPCDLFDQLPVDRSRPSWIVGSGASLLQALEELDGAGVSQYAAEPRPRAGLMLREVRAQAAAFPSIEAHRLTPRYVQSTIAWKKLAEQPRRV